MRGETLMEREDGSGGDTLAAVLDDAAEVFCFRSDERPQDRAHAYLARRLVRRGFNDTAMRCAVEDMVRRAHAVGVADGRGSCRAATRDIEGAETDPSCAKTGAEGANPDIEGANSQIRCGQSTETVDSPSWYTAGAVETIDKVEAVVDGLPARDAYLLGQVVRYVDRAGMKDEAVVDLSKANNYAHRLVRGKWRDR